MNVLEDNAESVFRKQVDEYKILRILATMMVVIGHSTYFTMVGAFGRVNHHIPTNITVTGIYGVFCKIQYIVYTFHMPLFFFLSGALYYISSIKNNRIGGLKDLALSKIKRLIIPYLGVGLFFLYPIKYFSGYYSNENIKESLWRGIILGGDAGHLWFLTTLFYVFVIFYIVEKWALKKYKGIFGIFIIVSLFLYSNYIIVPLPGFTNVFKYLFWFFMGYVFERYRNCFNRVILKFPIVSLSSSIWLYNTINFFTTYATCTDITIFPKNFLILMTTMVTICGILVTYIISFFLSKVRSINNSKLVDKLDRYSFDIYLYHDPLNYLILFIYSIMSDFTFLQYRGPTIVFLLIRTIGLVIVSVGIGFVVKDIRNRRA